MSVEHITKILYYLPRKSSVSKLYYFGYIEKKSGALPRFYFSLYIKYNFYPPINLINLATSYASVDNIKITLAQRESPQLMLSILLSSFSKVLRNVSIPIPCIFPPRISILPTQNPNKFSALCCLDIFF